MRIAVCEAFGILRQDGHLLRRPVARIATSTVFNDPQRTICVECRVRATFAQISRYSIRRDGIPRHFEAVQRRQFSSQRVLRRDEKPTPELSTETTKSLDPSLQTSSTPKAPSDIPLNGSSVHTVPDESLPSHRERQQWTLTKRFNAVMDSLLPRIALLSQRINSYTGTDYSGIEALRQEIKEQEALVKARHSALANAKADLESARATQSASQKEVVGLLERKHSWSAADLERYMSLIRSEHLNEQAVQGAKDAVATTERALEEARTRLEKRERAQYHEEQIWSDTIRRNSTWVTIGLMGVNIVLLLANVVLLEPRRRKRLVREVRSALEEHKLAVAREVPILGVESEVDDAMWPAGVPLETLEEEQVAATRTAAVVVETAELGKEEKIVEDAVTLPEIRESALWSFEGLKLRVVDLFSARIVQIRRIDVTAVAVEGVFVGATTALLAVYLLFKTR